jgi:hypothetical protein
MLGERDRPQPNFFCPPYHVLDGQIGGRMVVVIAVNVIVFKNVQGTKIRADW